ncbi:MAG: serine/threonine-protein kinase [Myxococcales bacterium]
MVEPFANLPILVPGTCIAGTYVLEEVLGTGGSAVVYGAQHTRLKKRVALKVYPIRPGTDPSFVQRFQQEASFLARVHHENVIAVYDDGFLDDGSPYLVVQRLRGETLATRLDRGPLHVDDVVDVALEMLAALSALARVGITHRDVKPENVMFDRSPDGHSVLKLVDFGVAKDADTMRREDGDALDELVGTPRYMSPEQMRCEHVDPRSDLYSLGAMLYELLTGRTPHSGDTLEEIALATWYAPIASIRSLRPDCPVVLERIILKALAREPECRYETASEMRKELERWNAMRRTAPISHLVAALKTPAALPQVASL